MAAPKHTGVAELCPQIVIPQVGMGVEVNDMEIGIPLHRRAHSA